MKGPFLSIFFVIPSSYNSGRLSSIPELVPNQRACHQPHGTLRNRCLTSGAGRSLVSINNPCSSIR